jgi:ribosomal protein S18 acetylase RimI-like enzyme
MGLCDGIVHLRRAREDDARSIAEVHVGTWRQAYAGLIPAALLDALDVDAREGFWRRVLKTTSESRRPWLADVDGQVAGFVSAGESHDDDAATTTGEVYAIYVTAECWGRGVGRNLLAHAERDLREHGYDAATLWVLVANERARTFYESAGWLTDGGERVETFAGAELPEVRYRKACR